MSDDEDVIDIWMNEEDNILQVEMSGRYRQVTIVVSEDADFYYISVIPNIDNQMQIIGA